jgi:hypothetical protein
MPPGLRSGAEPLNFRISIITKSARQYQHNFGIFTQRASEKFLHNSFAMDIISARLTGVLKKGPAGRSTHPNFCI